MKVIDRTKAVTQHFLENSFKKLSIKRKVYPNMVVVDCFKTIKNNNDVSKHGCGGSLLIVLKQSTTKTMYPSMVVVDCFKTINNDNDASEPGCG